jgi:hypothetical protein
LGAVALLPPVLASCFVLIAVAPFDDSWGCGGEEEGKSRAAAQQRRRSACGAVVAEVQGLEMTIIRIISVQD